VVAACSSGKNGKPSSAPTVPGFVVTSPAFSEGQAVPEVYTCDGADTSPPLAVAGVPPQARALVLVVDDPDAPGGVFTHWVVFGLPPSPTSFPEGTLPAAAQQGRNDFGKSVWGGPCPPAGAPHHYRFRALALDAAVAIPADASGTVLADAVKGHVLAEARMTATYARKAR
jgi:Raf kinase inhibitor-like YbhB/YbcL family protein